MKTKIALIPLLSAALVGSLFAQQGPQQGPRNDRQPPTPEQMLEHFDLNEDGVIDKEEIQTVSEQRQQKMQERKNQRQNNDGTAANGEGSQQGQGGGKGQGPRKDPNQMAQRVVEEFDTDGDGLLSADELQEFFVKMQKRGGPVGPNKGKGPGKSTQSED